MKWFKNLNIAKKLISGFVLVAVIGSIIGFIGISSLQSMEESDKKLYENMTEPVTWMSQISTYFQRIRVNTREIVLAENSEEIEVYAKKMEAYIDSINAYGAKFETRMLSDELKREWDVFKQTRVNYRKDLQELISLARVNEDVEAFKLIKGALNISSRAEMNAILSLVDMKTRHAKENYTANTEQADSATITMIVVIVLGLGISILLGYFIARSIANPIKLVVERMQSLSGVDISNLLKGTEQLGNGDLNIDIKTVTNHIDIDSKDEVGLLAENMNKIISDTRGTADSVWKAVESVKATVDEINLIVDASVNGRLQTRGDSSKFSGSYKELVDGLNNTLEAVSAPINEQSNVLEKMSSGDLTIRMKGDYKGDFLVIKNSINNLAVSFNKAIKEVSEAVHATASASSQISSSSEEMAAGAQEQSSQTSEIAGAVEQMTKTILQTTQNASTAAEQAKKSGTAAKDGGEVIIQTISGMNRIAEVVKEAAVTVKELGASSEQIGSIIQVIDDIADQTNLLALNAAIEAARAGEQGRGFAVVADEVRKLAERTTKATKEIEVMIKKIQNDTGEAVQSIELGTKEVEKGIQLAEKSNKSLDEIIVSANDVVDVINQVASASEEQSSTSEQISKSIDSISSVAQQSADGVQQIARASEDLNNLTMNLQSLVEKFRIDDIKKVDEVLSSKNGSGRLTVRSNGVLINEEV